MRVRVAFEGQMFKGEEVPSYFEADSFNELLELLHLSYKVLFRKMLAHNVGVVVKTKGKEVSFDIANRDIVMHRNSTVVFIEGEGMSKSSLAGIFSSLTIAAAVFGVLPGGFGAVVGSVFNSFSSDPLGGALNPAATARGGINTLIQKSAHPRIYSGALLLSAAIFARSFQVPDDREINNKASHFFTPDNNLEEQDQPIPLALGTNVVCGSILAGYSLRLRDED